MTDIEELAEKILYIAEYRMSSVTKDIEDITALCKAALGKASMNKKYYTWEEKIESLVKLAKAAGRYINSEETDLLSPSTRSDYYHDAQRNFRDAYAEFCEWRHDEPYVVDEIKKLID